MRSPRLAPREGSGIWIASWAELGCIKVVIARVLEPFARGAFLQVQRLS